MSTRSRVRLRKAIQEQLDELEQPRGHGPWSQERLDSLRVQVARRHCERIVRYWQEIEAPTCDGIFVALDGKLYKAPISDDPLIVRQIVQDIHNKDGFRQPRRWSLFADGPIIAKKLVQEPG